MGLAIPRDMSDIDTKVLNADPMVMTHLACYLNHAMERNQAARDAYRATYGTEWAALGDGLAINDGATTRHGTMR